MPSGRQSSTEMNRPASTTNFHQISSKSSPINLVNNSNVNASNNTNTNNNINTGSLKKTDYFTSNKSEHTNATYENTNITLLKPSGKLLDAVSAASNSVEDGLGPVVVPLSSKGVFSASQNNANININSKNGTEKISAKANNKLNKLLSSYGFGENSESVEPVIKNGKSLRGSSPDNRRSLHLESKKNEDYMINNSFNSSSMSSFTALKKKSAATTFKPSEPFKNDQAALLSKDKHGKLNNGNGGVNDPRQNAKSSLGFTDTNNMNSQAKSQAPIMVNNKKINQNSNENNTNANNNNEGNMERPPGRLNNYDSDTNTFSGDTNPMNFRRNTNEHLNAKLNKGECQSNLI